MLKKARGEPLTQPVEVSVSQPEGSPVEQCVQMLLRMLYLRDYETELHTQRVAQLSLELATKLGLAEELYAGIRIGALLHDIGKLVIPDAILFKVGKLTTAEWQTLQTHPRNGYNLLAPVAFFRDVVDIPFCHHEHWDGSGYPRGMKAEEIPLNARIFSIADVWDSLSTDRPYRPAWKLEDARFFMKEQAGVMFDPGLMPAFFEIAG